MSTPNHKPRVKETIDLLAKETREVIRRIRHDAMEEARKGNYETSKSVAEFAGKLELLAGDVDQLARQWQTIVAQHDELSGSVQSIVGSHLFRNGRNDKFSQRATYCPYILEALVKMGGRGKAKDVVAAVQPKLKVLFPALSRARKIMVYEDGRMKQGSPKGVWEISTLGRQWLDGYQG